MSLINIENVIHAIHHQIDYKQLTICNNIFLCARIMGGFLSRARSVQETGE